MATFSPLRSLKFCESVLKRGWHEVMASSGKKIDLVTPQLGLGRALGWAKSWQPVLQEIILHMWELWLNNFSFYWPHTPHYKITMHISIQIHHHRVNSKIITANSHQYYTWERMWGRGPTHRAVTNSGPHSAWSSCCARQCWSVAPGSHRVGPGFPPPCTLHILDAIVTAPLWETEGERDWMSWYFFECHLGIFWVE